MDTESPKRERFQVAWSRSSTIKRVDIVDGRTGRRMIGRDWASWDAAYQRALYQLRRQIP